MRGAAWILAFAVAAGAVVWLLVSRRSDAGADRMLADLTADIDRGGIADLGRAQALGRRLALANPRDREAAARLGVRRRDAGGRLRGRHLARDGGRAGAHGGYGASQGASDGASDDASVIALAARALDRLHAGDREAAGRLAGEAAAAASDLPHPLYALGRVRARNGDLPGAARALEAAMIRGPGFSPARVAWAEVQLDLGDAKAARGALQAVLAQAPKDARVALMLNEAEAALGVPLTPLPFSDCPADRWLPPAIVATCTLARAERARRAGSRAEARALAEAAAALAPDEPRLLSRAALALCQLGAVDRAAALVERARRSMAPGALAAALGGGGGIAGARPREPAARRPAARRSRDSPAGGAREPGGRRHRRAVVHAGRAGGRRVRTGRRRRRDRAAAPRRRARRARRRRRSGAGVRRGPARAARRQARRRRRSPAPRAVRARRRLPRGGRIPGHAARAQAPARGLRVRPAAHRKRGLREPTQRP